jgi:general secretion pathway protein A
LDVFGAAEQPARDAAPRSESRSDNVFYGFTENPFSLSTDPKFVYHSVSHDAAAQELLSAIRRRDDLAVLTGERGIGKTTLCRAVMEELDHRTLTAYVDNPLASPERLLETVLFAFGVVAKLDGDGGPRASRQDLAAALRDFVASLAGLRAFAVVFVDDAHNLPAESFEVLAGVSDMHAKSGLLQIVLVGEPALREKIAASSRVAERVTVECELGPLGPDEVGGYIARRLQLAGSQPRVAFTTTAVESIFALSRGVPGIVNVLCDRALALGSAVLTNNVDTTLVARAAADVGLDSGVGPERNTWRRAAVIAALALLAILGAGTAAWVFREPLSRIVTSSVGRPAQAPGAPPHEKR